jgi:hypothetical protein
VVEFILILIIVVVSLLIIVDVNLNPVKAVSIWAHNYLIDVRSIVFGSSSMRGRFALLPLASSWLGCGCPLLPLNLILALLPMPVSFEAWPATFPSLLPF